MRRHSSPLFRLTTRLAHTGAVAALTVVLAACGDTGQTLPSAPSSAPSAAPVRTFYPSTAPATFEQWKTQWTRDPCSALTLSDLSIINADSPWHSATTPQPDGTFTCQWRSGNYAVTAAARGYGPETGAKEVRLNDGRTAMIRHITDSGLPDWWIIVPTFGGRGGAVLGVNDRGANGRELTIALANSVLPRLPR